MMVYVATANNRYLEVSVLHVADSEQQFLVSGKACLALTVIYELNNMVTDVKLTEESLVYTAVYI